MKSYKYHLEVRNPIKTKMITAFVLSSVGDVVCQYLLRNKKEEWKWDR